MRIFATTVVGHQNNMVEVWLYKISARSSHESDGIGMTRFLQDYPNFSIDTVKTMEFFESDFK